MAKTWYFAECKKCMEVCRVMVNNPKCTAAYLGDYNRQISKWLIKHYGCELTLGWRDDHLDALWPQGYEVKDLWFEKTDEQLEDENDV